MDWYIVLALAVPFLFVIGVIYNALKEQKVLEDGQLKKVLTERKAKGLAPAPADDDDDYGLPARQDLKRAAPPSSAAAPASVPPRHQPLGNTEAKNAASYFAQYYQAEQSAPTESPAAEAAESQTEEATAPERAAK